MMAKIGSEAEIPTQSETAWRAGEINAKFIHRHEHACARKQAATGRCDGALARTFYRYK